MNVKMTIIQLALSFVASYKNTDGSQVCVTSGHRLGKKESMIPKSEDSQTRFGSACSLG